VWSLAGASALAATPADAESGRAATSGLSFRFDKDAFAVPAAQTGLAEPERASRFSVRLYGGLSRVAAGDVNDGSDGYFELLEVYDALGFGTAEGGYSPLHWGANFGADFVFQLTPCLGVGLGAGYMRAAEDSEMILTNETESIALDAKPVLTAVPIRLGLFLNVPVAPKIKFTADAGATYYAGFKFVASQRITFDGTDWMEMSVTGKRSGLADNLGFQGGLGLEFEVSPTMGFFVEAVGRYAKLKNFDSVTTQEVDSDGGSDSDEGKLYIVTYTFVDGSYSLFTIEDTPPVDDPPGEVYREPKFDLSGFSLQAGIRIRF
ncbi:MAG: outer membrane beta-barrel protein, partial [Candidatus Aminicenantes bacterium]|nr:outer membrane beta-barrel protein [Candidatus Aminicenantes bacterium]